MNNHVRHLPGSGLSTCNNDCDDSVSTAGSNTGDPANLIRDLGHDI